MNTISSGAHPTHAATCDRAFAIASRVASANAWPLEGFPKWSHTNGAMASATSGNTGVVAL